MILEVLKRLFPFEVDGGENLDLLRKRQEQNGRLGVLVCANHGAVTDPIRIALLLKPLKRGVIGEISFVIAKDHVEFFRDPLYASLARLGEKVGKVETVSVVQAYRLRDKALVKEERERIEKEVSRVGRAFLRKAAEIAQKGDCLVIFPEGHRNQIGGQLQPAEKGLGNLVDRVPLILPVGINYPEKSSRGFGFGEEVTLVVGKPLTRGELEEREEKMREEYGIQGHRSIIHHAVMCSIRDLLPTDRWGVYHPSNKDTFTRVLNNEIVLRRSSDGRVLPMDMTGNIYPIGNR